MSLDLTATAGFPLLFDLNSLELKTGGDLVFRRVSRTAAYLKEVLLYPEGMAPETELYQLHELEDGPALYLQALNRYDLTYSFVLMPPRCIGSEFVKTHGHYHPLMPGARLAFPEVYTQIYGTLTLLLQRADPHKPDQVLDCALVEMTPGIVLTVPPGYAHVLINATQAPGLMAGLYDRSFRPDYAPVREKRGLAYYLIRTEDHSVDILPNPRYPGRPHLRRLTRLAGTPFEPPEAGQPVWRSFFSNSERYSFLSRPKAAAERFAREVNADD